MQRTLSRSTAEGALVLVVGPSGVGKDTLIDAARTALADDARVVFMRRDITRSVDAGGEQHNEIDATQFRKAECAGAYALSWAAHGRSYGIPRSMESDLAAGRTVIVNGSRAVIDHARAKYGRVIVCHVTAPADALRARLAARGRETAAEIEDRVLRADAFSVVGDDVVTIVNDGPLERSLGVFIDAIRARR